MDDDPEWFWVQKSDGEEGFVPAGFIYPLDALQKQQTMSGGLFQTSQPLPPVPTSLGTIANTGGSNHHNNNHLQLHSQQSHQVQQQYNNHNQHQPGGPISSSSAGAHSDTGNGSSGGRNNFLATPTLASPVAQQFSQLSISPQQISSGPMSNMSSLSAPLSSISGHVSLPGSVQTSLPGSTNQHGLPSSGHQSLPGHHGIPCIINGNHSSTSPDIISSTTGGFGNNQKSSSLHNMSASSHQMSSAHSVAMSLGDSQQMNSLTSNVSGIRSTGSVTTGSTVNSGPNSLTPGTANGLPPPPSTQGGGGGGGSGRSSQLGGGGSQSGGETRYGGTELVMLYDYKAQAPDDLSVRRGDWIYADLQNQTVDGWLWAYAPKTRKYGFIPKAYARPPAMTNL